MFIISQDLKPEKIPEGKGGELFQNHVAWFTKHFEKGDFLLVGPYTDREMSGLMICAAETREELESILKEDVYYAEGMAVYDVRPFKGIKISAHFADYAGK